MNQLNNKQGMITKRTSMVSFRCKKNFYKDLPKEGRSEYLNAAVEAYQKNIEDEINYDLKISTLQEGLINFFMLFQQNAGNLDITDEQEEYFMKLLEDLKRE